MSRAEIEELRYNDDRPADQRAQRLRELRDELDVRASGDFRSDDPRAAIREIDAALAGVG